VTSGILNFSTDYDIELCILQQSPYHHSELVGDLSKKISDKLRTPSLFVKTKSIIKKNSAILVPIDENLGGEWKVAVALAKKISGKVIFYHTTWKDISIESDQAIDHCDPRVKKNILQIKNQINDVDYLFKIEMADSIHGGIICNATKYNVDLVIMRKSKSIIGGQDALVLNNSAFPLLIIK